MPFYIAYRQIDAEIGGYVVDERLGCKARHKMVESVSVCKHIWRQFF